MVIIFESLFCNPRELGLFQLEGCGKGGRGEGRMDRQTEEKKQGRKEEKGNGADTL